MNENGVERAVLLQGGYLGFQNLYSWQAQQKWPDRFLAAGAYDPYSRSRDGIVRRLFEELGLRVVKFEVSTGSGLMANHPVFPLDGEVMEREAAFAQEHGLVFVIDIGKLGSPSSQIQALRRLIRRHAGMKFVVCHLLAPKQTQLREMADGLAALALPVFLPGLLCAALSRTATSYCYATQRDRLACLLIYGEPAALLALLLLLPRALGLTGVWAAVPLSQLCTALAGAALLFRTRRAQHP